jgi:MEMO1 family protein
MALPAIRLIDASQVEHEGQAFICIRDPEGFVEEQLLLSPVAFFVASMLDGTNAPTDIQYEFMKQTRKALPDDLITEVVEYLDEQGFLMTERGEARIRKVVEEFAASNVRPAYVAGKSYPDDADELRAFLDVMCEHEKSRGEQPGAAEAPVRCLVVPHIDFERGGPTYARGYHRLAQGQRPDTVLLFGVAHAGPQIPFILTRKDFATPLGTLKTDTDIVDRLAAACDWDPFEYEIVHRTEHSIEFQAVMLAHLFGEDVKIVPILCGPFVANEEFVDPATLGGVQAFLDVCQDLVRRETPRVAVIAGADLAHVGRRFGDDFEIDDTIVERIRTRDTEDLAHVTAVAPDAWYQSVMKDDNARRVCGLNCIYAALTAVDETATGGELLHYGYAPDPAGGIVSFAGVVVT